MQREAKQQLFVHGIDLIAMVREIDTEGKGIDCEKIDVFLRRNGFDLYENEIVLIFKSLNHNRKERKIGTQAVLNFFDIKNPSLFMESCEDSKQQKSKKNSISFLASK